MSAGPHSHPFHLPIPGVLGHSLLMHGVHGLREERSAHICAAPPGFDPPSAPAEPGGGLCVELLVLRPRGTHLGVRTWSTCRSPSCGDPFGVLTSSTRCTSGSFSYGEPTLGSSSPAPGAHLGHPPMGNPMWGPHHRHPLHALVIVLWGSHFGGPHVQHPVHVWVALLWGTHLGGPHLPHPVHFGHPPMEFPFWGSSPCASGACCPERRRRAPGGAVGVRQWGGRGWATSCCVRSRAKGRGWGPTWRPVKGLGLERGPAEGFRPAGGPGSTSSAWGLPGSWGGRGKGRENPDGAELGASGALTTA